MRGGLRVTGGMAAAWLLSACSGPQSALDPQGPHADNLARLFWIFTVISAVIWLAVMVVLVLGLARRVPNRLDPLALEPRAERRSLVVVGGAVVATALTLGASTTGNLVLAPPGLLVAQSGTSNAVTVVATASRNAAFARSALILAARLPALPDDGDMADDRTTVVDPRSGFAFELAMYKQYRQVQYEISAAWGVKNIKPEHTALLIGG